MLKISTAPHINSPVTTQSIMRDVIIALCPAILVALLFFGVGALKVIVTSVAACVLFEYLICRYLLKTNNTTTDYSAIITGILLAFNLPSNMPVWMILIGAFVAIGITKMAF
ncbi:MAG: RnfABCDGE type electron transport complex subunit D, partial [Alphaproteobacteria bacterium]